MVLRRVYRAEKDNTRSEFWNVYPRDREPIPLLPTPWDDERLCDPWKRIIGEDRKDMPWFFAFCLVQQVEKYTTAVPEFFRSVALRPGPQHIVEGDTQLIFHESARVDSRRIQELGGFPV